MIPVQIVPDLTFLLAIECKLCIPTLLLFQTQTHSRSGWLRSPVQPVPSRCLRNLLKYPLKTWKPTIFNKIWFYDKMRYFAVYQTGCRVCQNGNIAVHTCRNKFIKIPEFFVPGRIIWTIILHCIMIQLKSSQTEKCCNLHGKYSNEQNKWFSIAYLVKLQVLFLCFFII